MGKDTGAIATEPAAELSIVAADASGGGDAAGFRAAGNARRIGFKTCTRFLCATVFSADARRGVVCCSFAGTLRRAWIRRDFGTTRRRRRRGRFARVCTTGDRVCARFAAAALDRLVGLRFVVFCAFLGPESPAVFHAFFATFAFLRATFSAFLAFFTSARAAFNRFLAVLIVCRAIFTWFIPNFGRRDKRDAFWRERRVFFFMIDEGGTRGWGNLPRLLELHSSAAFRHTPVTKAVAAQSWECYIFPAPADRPPNGKPTEHGTPVVPVWKATNQSLVFKPPCRDRHRSEAFATRSASCRDAWETTILQSKGRDPKFRRGSELPPDRSGAVVLMAGSSGY